MSGPTQGILRSVGLAAALIAIQAAIFAPWVERERIEAELSVEHHEDLEIPAEIRLLETALGSFRGWLIHVLWLRAGQLEDEGRVHESMQLSRWITRLQPNYPQVWFHQASTLVFNNSISTRDLGERYLWIESGISLLRDEGIPINRRSRFLYRQLAYIFWFKLGDDSRDEAREYYWRRFAAEWDQILGPPQGDTAEERAAWFAPIAESPRDWRDVLAKFPALEGDRESLEAVVSGDTRGFIASVSRAERGLSDWVGWLNDPQRGEAHRAILACLRAKVLRETYKMDPLLMLDLTRTLGPIDWRHPAAHAVYWSAVGVLRIETGEDFPRLTPELRRVLDENSEFSIGMKQLVARGRLGGDPVLESPTHLPEFRFFNAYERAIFGDDFETAEEVPATDQLPYWRILEGALTNAWLRGNQETAEACLLRLRRFYDEVSETPRDWILDQLRAELPEDPEERRFELTDRLHSQFFEALREGIGVGEPEIAARREELGETLWSEATMLGVEVAPLEQIRLEARQFFFQATSDVVSVKAKGIVWRGLSAEERAAMDQRMVDYLRDSAQRAGLDPAEVFPL